MCRTVSEVVKAIEVIASAFDPDVIHPKDAPALLERCAKGKKIFSALEALVAERVASSGNWQSEGDKSPANFVSRKTGETVREAAELITTARALRELPKTDEAFRSGRLTQEQAAEIVSAATVAPQAEDHLITLAEKQGLIGVREEARRVQAAACQDQNEKWRRLHRQRFLRTWVERDGAYRLTAQLTPEAGAELQAVLDATVKERIKRDPDARAERQEAVAADALLEIARYAASGTPSRMKAEVVVRVDLDALGRGYVKEGEVCEARGVGPISIAGAAQFLDNSLVRLVGLKGSEVTRVAHAGRYVGSKVKGASKDRSPP